MYIILKLNHIYEKSPDIPSCIYVKDLLSNSLEQEKYVITFLYATDTVRFYYLVYDLQAYMLYG